MMNETKIKAYNNYLLDFAHTLNRQTDYGEILRLTVMKTCDILEAENTMIMLINPGTRETVKTVVRKSRTNLDLAQHQITGWMMHEQPFFICEDIARDKRFSRMDGPELQGQSVVAVLLQVENIVLGSLLVFRGKGFPPFDSKHLTLLEHIAVIAAPYLRNVKKIEEYFLPDISTNALVHKYAETGLIGESSVFTELLQAVETAARSDVRVILEGESGTGKELIALAIHRFSKRCDQPFIAIDCGTILGHLIESELFGHKKGAYTGALQDRKGMIEEADGGTFFIDEVANLPLEIQSKFMRFLQEGEIKPLGANETRKVNARIISACSRSLRKLVEEGDFRQDLFFRLHVYPVYVPPLRARGRDVLKLAHHFLHYFSQQQNKKLDSFSPQFIEFIKKRSWPGNIRELQNFIERIVTLCSAEDTVVDDNILPADLRAEWDEKTALMPQNQNVTLKEQMRHHETIVIRRALEKHGWNQSAAARSLGISEAIIRYRMKKIGIIREK